MLCISLFCFIWGGEYKHNLIVTEVSLILKAAEERWGENLLTELALMVSDISYIIFRSVGNRKDFWKSLANLDSSLDKLALR